MNKEGSFYYYFHNHNLFLSCLFIYFLSFLSPSLSVLFCNKSETISCPCNCLSDFKINFEKFNLDFSYVSNYFCNGKILIHIVDLINASISSYLFSIFGHRQSISG